MEINDSILKMLKKKKTQAHTYNYGTLTLQCHAIASQHGAHLIVGVSQK